MHRDILPYLLCPGCGSSSLEATAFDGADPLSIEEGTVGCGGCGLWFRIENGILDFLPLYLRRDDLYAPFAQKHGLSLEESRAVAAEQAQKQGQIDYFSEDSGEYEERVVGSPYYQALDRIAFHDWLERNRHRLDGMVLDIGCGTGRQSVPLAEAGVRTLAIDTAEEMLRVAADKLGERGLDRHVDLIVADGEAPPVKDGAFSACIYYGVLHHMPDKARAIANGSRKLVADGLYYSLDPHKSPVRFLFDALMRVWKLYHEEASDDPLLTSAQLEQWMTTSGLTCSIKLTTYLPPHVFELVRGEAAVRLLRGSDAVCNAIPGLRGLAGVIAAEGQKTR